VYPTASTNAVSNIHKN